MFDLNPRVHLDGYGALRGVFKGLLGLAWWRLATSTNIDPLLDRERHDLASHPKVRQLRRPLSEPARRIVVRPLRRLRRHLPLAGEDWLDSYASTMPLRLRDNGGVALFHGAGDMIAGCKIGDRTMAIRSSVAFALPAAAQVRRCCYQSVMQVLIASDVMAALLAVAAESPDQEVCGLLYGRPDRIEAAERTANVADDPARAFEIEPAALFMAIRLERQGGPGLIGHYHSHPNGRAEPSPRDLAASEPGRLWLIIGGGLARLWLAEVGAFREMQLIVT